MDLAACAQRVFIAMEHNTREGEPSLLREPAPPPALKRCKLPITAPGVVKMLVTDLGLFGISPDGFELLENAPGWNPEEKLQGAELPPFFSGSGDRFGADAVHYLAFKSRS